MQKNISHLLLAAVIFMGINSFADVLYLHCYKGETPETCATKTQVAMAKLGCLSEPTKTSCTYSLVVDPENPKRPIASTTPYCEVTSLNCSQPRVGNFGGESCGSQTMVYLAKGDSVHNGYYFGAGPYSRTICIAK